jgi:hypothetical protein
VLAIGDLDEDHADVPRQSQGTSWQILHLLLFLLV